MFFYSAYGLRIRSSILLPELVQRDAGQDVVIRVEKGSRSSLRMREISSCRWLTRREALVRYRRIGSFYVRRGEEIAVHPIPGVGEEVLRTFLLGPVLGLLLLQRGELVLHASAVEMQGAAAVFLGGKGFGKSTLAARLYQQGHGVIADDITAIQIGKKVSKTSPGFPGLKLWPDAINLLGEDSRGHAPLHRFTQKRAYRTILNFPYRPARVRHIYVLAQGRTPGLETLSEQEGFVELIRHSRYLHWLPERQTLLNFFQCVELGHQVAFRRLTRTRNLHCLPPLVRWVEDDLMGRYR